MDEQLQAAQEQLLEKRRALGLDEQGRTPGVVSLKEALTQGLASIPSPTAEDLANQTCPECQHPLPVIEFDVLGKIRRRLGNCPVCFPKREQEEAHRQERQETEKRLSRYRRAFPFDAGGELAVANLENFSPRTGTPGVLQLVKRYTEQLPKPKVPGLLMFGDPGNGKSHLAAAIANAARSQGMAVAWIDAKDWFREIGTLESGDREELIRLAYRADLVVIDDLGARKLTEARAEWLLTIVDNLYRHRKPLVVTSNLDPDQLVKAITPPRERDGGKPDKTDKTEFLDGTRVIDRLAEMSIFVKNEATSYRMELARRRAQEGGLADG